MEHIADDATLLERMAAGEQGAFDALVRKYQREIYFLALRMTRNAEDAEEMAQKTFVAAYRKAASFEGRSSFRTWLYQVCINLCSTFLRRRKTVVELSEFAGAGDDSGEQEPLASIIKGETARRAAAAVEQLPEKQRMSVTLRIFHDMPFRDIGEAVGCSENTAKVNFHHGMETLRKRFKDDGTL